MKGQFPNLAPAHVARRVGWNQGFDDWRNVISGSWYQISDYQPGRSVTLSRNPRFWGAPAKLDSLTFRLFGGSAAAIAAFREGQADIISPTSISPATAQEVSRTPGIRSRALPAQAFEHLDFNEANPYLGKVQVRRAIAEAVDRPKLLASTLAAMNPGIAPLDDRMILPGQRGYLPNGAYYDRRHLSKARARLAALGFRRVGAFVEPETGPLRKQPLTFTLTSTTGNPVRLTLEHLIQRQLHQIGIRILIRNQSAATLFGTTLRHGRFDLTEFAWVASGVLSSNQALYCSFSLGAQCAENYDHFANPRVDRLTESASESDDLSTEIADFDAADKILWNRMVTLPLSESVDYTAWSSRLTGVEPNTYSQGNTWNAYQWTYAPSSGQT